MKLRVMRLVLLACLCLAACKDPLRSSNVLRLQDTPADFTALGLRPNEIQVWEDGRRAPQSGTNYEWWYFDAKLNDGSVVVVTFSGNITGDERREVSVDFTSRETGHITLNKKLSAPGVFASDHCAVSFGENTFTGDLNTYHIHVDPDNDQKLGLDLTLHRTVPSFRAATGVISAGSRFFGWFNPVPRGDVAGTISIAAQTKQVVGVGYHDHNWGNVSPGELLDTWWWGRGNASENTVVTYVIRGNKNVGASEIVLYYVGSASGVKLNAAGKGVCAVEGAKGVHRDPKHVRSIPSGMTVVANGYRTEFRAETAPILSLDLLKDQSSWKQTLARTMGMKPWYTRFDSPITLETAHHQVIQGDAILEYYELH